jgi:hypothetical protein
MDKLAQICRDAAQYEHIMTFSEIGQAISRGAIAGHKAKIPGGALTGAVVGLCVETGGKVVLITQDLLTRLENKYV